MRRTRRAGDQVELAWNPEFLREGFAVEDTLHPDRLVFGVPRRGAERAAAARSTRRSLAAGTPMVVTDFATAELVKVAANSFLATKISFINAMAEVCEATGADVHDLADALGYDDRIGGKFLNAGLGFGGGCLPKDIRAFRRRAEELGVGQAVAFLREVDAINLRRRSDGRPGPRALRRLGCSASGSPCSAPRSSRTPTTSATRRPWTSPPSCSSGADVVV